MSVSKALSQGRTFCLVLAAVSWTNLLVLGQETARQIDWQSDYPAALELAKSQSRPLLVAFNMDDDPGNDRTARDSYQDAQLVELSRSFVCVIASIGEHSAAPALCSRFGAITCAQHKRTEIDASDALVGRAQVIAPQHFFLSPDGEVLERRVYEQPVAELRDIMRRVLGIEVAAGKARPINSDAEQQEVDRLFDSARGVKKPKKRKAVKELAGRNSSIARQALLEAMVHDDDEELRVLIMEAMARSGDYALLEPLIAASKERRDAVVMGAIRALGILGLPDGAPTIRKQLNRQKGSGFGKTLIAYAASAGEDPDVIAAVMKAAKSSDSERSAYGLLAMQSLTHTEKTREVLVKALKSRSTRPRAAAVWTIGMARVVELHSDTKKLLDLESNTDVREIAAAVMKVLNLMEEQAQESKVRKAVNDLRGKIRSIMPI